MASVSDSSKRVRGDFQRVVEGFLLRPGLPFAEVLSAERIERIFKKHGNLFGVGQIYSTVVVLWSFISQALRDGKEAGGTHQNQVHPTIWGDGIGKALTL